MPLRSRLSNTGLKLKIPARSSPGVTSPYGPSPHKQSPSPHRHRREDGHTEDVVSTFDASVDGRAVWSVTSHRTKTKTEGFREIQIQHTQDLSVCDSGHTSASNNNKHTPVAEQRHHTNCISLHEPLVPLSPLRPTKDRQLDRAEVLRDWIQKLPSEPDTPRNPFFTRSSRASVASKRELNYQPYKYLSSPLPNFNQSPGSPNR